MVSPPSIVVGIIMPPDAGIGSVDVYGGAEGSCRAVLPEYITG